MWLELHSLIFPINGLQLRQLAPVDAIPKGLNAGQVNTTSCVFGAQLTFPALGHLVILLGTLIKQPQFCSGPSPW